MTEDTPKPRRGRPRVYATPEESRLADIARANAATRARRQSKVHRTISMTPATAAKADVLVGRRGLGSLTALVEALVDEEFARE